MRTWLLAWYRFVSANLWRNLTHSLRSTQLWYAPRRSLCRRECCRLMIVSWTMCCVSCVWRSIRRGLMGKIIRSCHPWIFLIKFLLSFHRQGFFWLGLTRWEMMGFLLHFDWWSYREMWRWLSSSCFRMGFWTMIFCRLWLRSAAKRYLK